MSSSDVARRARRRLLGTAALAATSTVAGCGFHLRGAVPLPFRSIALTGFAPRSPLADELRTALARDVRVADSPNEVDVVLHAMADVRERSVVAQTAAAQVRALQLRLRLQFRASTPSGRELLPASTLLLARDVSYNETLALAKAQEEAELYREMQADIVLQVLRRLASIKV
jgi:LPS-assembly lipoprotein